jgi:hypothetical protein
MNVIKLWEAINNAGKSFGDRRLHELDFSHVEFSNSGNFETRSNDGWGFSLGLTQGDIDEFTSVWNLLDLLEIIAHFYRFCLKIL